MVDLIKKILFLDIDGVLNSASSAEMYHRLNAETGNKEWRPKHDFCPLAVSNLCALLDWHPDLKIVISSTWRLGRDTLQELKDIFAPIEPTSARELIQSRIIDKTPAMRAGPRGYEIQKWLTDNIDKCGPNFQFVITDDDSDMVHLMRHFVQTMSDNGLTFTDAQKIRRKLQTDLESSRERALEYLRKARSEFWGMPIQAEADKKINEVRDLLNSPENNNKWGKQ